MYLPLLLNIHNLTTHIFIQLVILYVENFAKYTRNLVSTPGICDANVASQESLTRLLKAGYFTLTAYFTFNGFTC